MSQDSPSKSLSKALADEARADRAALLIAAGLLVASFVIDSLSMLYDFQRGGRTIDPRLPWLYEGSSIIVLMALLPALAWLTRRFPVSTQSWRSAAPVYALALVAYSAIHIFGMVLIRKAAFALEGQGSYIFFSQGRYFSEALYEFRKDIFSFVLFVGLFEFSRRFAELEREAAAARSEAETNRRLTLKCGGRMIYLDAASVDWAKAAGNYVEIAASGRTHLARMTMTALEEQLDAAGANVARAHRSWLVNRDRIAQITPAGDGDVVVTLADGFELPGSRRYRDRLERAALAKR